MYNTVANSPKCVDPPSPPFPSLRSPRRSVNRQLCLLRPHGMNRSRSPPPRRRSRSHSPVARRGHRSKSRSPSLRRDRKRRDSSAEDGGGGKRGKDAPTRARRDSSADGGGRGGGNPSRGDRDEVGF